MQMTLWVSVLMGLFLMAASAIKWSLPIKKALLIIIIACVFGIIAGYSLNNLSSTFLSFFLILIVQFFIYTGQIAFLFYRDPERSVPSEKEAIVSPADGRVIYIREIKRGSLLCGEKRKKRFVYNAFDDSKLCEDDIYQIGIAMMFTDVHINRSPIEGTVLLQKHQGGKFLSLRSENAINLNERNSILIENKSIAIGIVQIASRLVRRIETYIKEGEFIEKGEKVGMIKFGSQVDMLIPKSKVKKIEISIGQYLYAGESIICRMKNI